MHTQVEKQEKGAQRMAVPLCCDVCSIGDPAEVNHAGRLGLCNQVGVP